MLLPDDALWHIHAGDCVPHMMEDMPPNCVHNATFSPPFPSVFSYTSLPEDLGNSEDLQGEVKIHLSYFYKALYRVLMPGRVACVHVTQIHRRKRDGEEGVYDFRGLNIRIAQRAGFVYDYDWCIRHNPQAQAIRTRKWELKFQGLESDRAISRGAMPDYVIKLRKPGENAVPIDSKGDVSRNDWIAWAEPCWNDIKETDTLNKKEARGPNDTLHICALQLGLIERLVRLYTNPGEIVFSPFCGIGSELVVALRLGRRGYGIEIKPEYLATAPRNCEKAVLRRQQDSRTLFDAQEAV